MDVEVACTSVCVRVFVCHAIGLKKVKKIQNNRAFYDTVEFDKQNSAVITAKVSGKLRDKEKKKSEQSKRHTKSIKMSIATTEEIENLPNNPEVLLIDVRDPPEIKSSGTIPTSINIPCKLYV